MRPGFIAHRGYSARYIENTPEAFQAAIDFGSAARAAAGSSAGNTAGGNIIGIELDVQMTSDGEIVVFHDGDLRRVCGSELVISQCDYAAIADASAASGKFNNSPVPLLADVLEQVDHRIDIYCEMKFYDFDPKLFIKKLAAILGQYNAGADVIIHSFSGELMQKAIAATNGSGMRYGLLFGAAELDSLPQVLGQIGDRLDYLHPHFGCLLENYDQLCSIGKPFNTWTVNTAADIHKLQEVDSSGMINGIITDDISLSTA